MLAIAALVIIVGIYAAVVLALFVLPYWLHRTSPPTRKKGRKP